MFIISFGEKFKATNVSFFEIITFFSKPFLSKSLIEKSFRFHLFNSVFQIAFF